MLVEEVSIVVGRPPNFELILAAFPDADKPGVIFAYGTDIYNPSGGNIPPALLAHEAVHQHRQITGQFNHRALGLSPEGYTRLWWEQYIDERGSEFRYTEELHAHVAEYKAQVAGLDRNRKAKLLQSTALRLIASLYNYTPPRTLAQAMRDLKQELGR